MIDFDALHKDYRDRLSADNSFGGCLAFVLLVAALLYVLEWLRQ